MATTAERFHIVLQPEEKRRWTEHAKAAGLPTSEYVRRAVEAYGEERLTPSEIEELKVALAELNAATERASQRLDAAIAHVDSWGSEAWEASIQRRVAEELGGYRITLNPQVVDMAKLK